MGALSARAILVACVGVITAQSIAVYASPLTTAAPSFSSGTCPIPGYQRCSSATPSTSLGPAAAAGPQALGDFCCPSDTTCVSADHGSTLVCCPRGRDCSTIKLISCDVDLQNATAFPESVIKTTRLHDDLPRCDAACCPHGYECTEQGECRMIVSTGTAPDSATSTTMTASTSYSTLTTVTSVDTKPTGHDTAATTSGQSVATQTGGPEGTASTGQAMHPEEADDGRQGERRHDDGYSAKAVGLGFGLGLLVGAILALSFLACLHCFHKRKSQDNSANAEGGHETEQAASRRFYTPTFMRFGNKQQGMVTDKQSSQQAPSTSFQERHRPKTSPSIPNPFARHDRTSRSLSSSNASDISRGAAHNPHASHPVSSSCSSSFSSPSSSSKASHIAASGPSPTPSAPQPIPPRSSSLKKTDSAASPAGRAAQHMGHSVLFRPRDAALSIDSYDATTWTRSVGRRSGDDDLQGRWRAYDGRGLGAPTDETTWSEIVRQSAKDQH